MVKENGVPILGQDVQAPLSMRHNAGIVTYVRIFGSLAAGLTAGIFGVTGWIGFSYYSAAHALVSTLLYAKAGGNVGRYFQSRRSLVFGEVFGSTTLLTFILFWTLAHNFIHLF